MLIVKDVSVSFQDVQVLDHVCLQVKNGEFISLIGTSGCGKSTLLNVLSGALKPQSGNFAIDGVTTEGMSHHFAYMPQNDLLLPWYTIMENVTLYGKIHHRQKETMQKASQAFEVFGLTGYEHAYPFELSGGMRQRAAFLRTALCDADILLLDEPFGALDVITRNDMQDWIGQMRKQWNKTTILVTHDIDEALYLSDRILVLKGRPAHIVKEISLGGIEKDRDWLDEQSELRKNIRNLLRGQADA